MSEVTMSVSLLAHTILSDDFDSTEATHGLADYHGLTDEFGCTNGQAVALTAIRTCYSPKNPSEIVEDEGDKYFRRKATDGEGGTEADRLIRQIVNSKHLSTLEHLTYTFAVEGVSRALLAQLTRHRVGFSFSVQSQRYVRFGSDDRSGGFDYVVPKSLKGKSGETPDGEEKYYADTLFVQAMDVLQMVYDDLRKAGVPAEDARAVLPNAAATNLVLTANLRALLDFYSKRKPGNGAQNEITRLAEELKSAVINVEPWTEPFFV